MVSRRASPIRIPVTAIIPTSVVIVAARSGVNSSSAALITAWTSALVNRYGVARREPLGPCRVPGTPTGRPAPAR